MNHENDGGAAQSISGDTYSTRDFRAIVDRSPSRSVCEVRPTK
jgi:hypothetical protein